jgi:hypothetical protein
VNIPTLKRLAYGAFAAAIGFALAQQDVLIPDQMKAVLIAVLGWLGSLNPTER